jgi:hypothetical protein
MRRARVSSFFASVIHSTIGEQITS